jgi:hypothetical protein
VSNVRVEYVLEGKRRIVRFRIESYGELESLKRAFECLSNGAKSAIGLVAEEMVYAPESVGEIELKLVDFEDSETPWVRIRKTASGKDEISWRRDREGWLECLELLGSLAPGTHQYFNYGVFSEVDIEAFFSAK